MRTEDGVIIEEFMLQQIKEGGIEAYLTDLLWDFHVLRDVGEGVYYWGVRGNGCGTDLIAITKLEQEFAQYGKPVPTSLNQKFNFDYPLAWAWALAQDHQEAALATVYKFVVKNTEYDGVRHRGFVTLVDKKTVREHLQAIEEGR